MLKIINKDKLKKLMKHKLFIPVFVAAIGLTGCGINNTNTNSNTNNQSIEQTIDYDVELHFNNWDRELQLNENIFFTDKDSVIYHAVTIEENGITKTTIKEDAGYIASYSLQQSVEIPNITPDEMIVVNVDYKEKTINVEVQEKNIESQIETQTKTR